MIRLLRIITLFVFFPFGVALAAKENLVERGHDAYDQGQFEKAIEYFSDALELSDLSALERADVYRARGLTYGRLQQNEKAIESYRNAIALNPKDIGAVSSLCFQYVKSDLLDKALAACNRALDIDENHAPTINIRAEIWKKKQENDRAEADYLRSVELDPKNWAIMFNLANFYDDTGRTSAAKFYYKKSYAAAPSWAHSHPLTQKAFKKYGLIN